MINYLKEFHTSKPVEIEGDSIGTRSVWIVGAEGHKAKRIEEENGVVRVYQRNGQLFIFTAGGWGFWDWSKEMKAEDEAEKKSKKNTPKKEKAPGVLDGGR